MNSVFNSYGIYKPMYGIWQFIKDIPFLVKCCHQRIHKGYCVKDTWDIDQWFVSTLKPMLQELRDNHRGFPSYFIDEFWQQHKDEMGMSYEDLRDKYTLIGRNKRESEDNIEGKTLGRKGIGKLAALYLSSKYFYILRRAKIRVRG